MAEILIGDYGLIARAEKGAETTAVAMANVAEGTWVEITAVDPAGPWALGGLKVGDPYYEPNPTATALTLVATDAFMPITQHVIGFARGWSMEFARNPIDTTALKDLQNTNIYGRPNLTGNLAGFLVTDDSEMDIVTQRFIETVKIDGTAATTVSRLEIETEPLAFIGYTLKVESGRAFIEAYYMPSMDLGTLNVGSEVGGLTDLTVPITLRQGSVKRVEIKLPTV